MANDEGNRASKRSKLKEVFAAERSSATAESKQEELLFDSPRDCFSTSHVSDHQSLLVDVKRAIALSIFQAKEQEFPL